MRVVTFNVRTSRNDLQWRSRAEHGRALLNRAHADVVGLQEIRRGPRDVLSSGHVVGDDRGDGEMCLLCLRDAPRRWGQFWLSETPDVAWSVGWDAMLPRTCVWAELPDGTIVANTHLDHIGAEARRRGLELILDRVQPDVLVGDFNRGPHDFGSLTPVPTGPTHAGGTIDFIAVAAGWSWSHAQVVDTGGASDHQMIVADLTSPGSAG